jgi:Ca-activated chloride channel family protein
MEKSKTQVDSFPVYKELFMKFALIALFALAFEILFKLFVSRRIP